MNNISVVGGAGFLGRELVTQLLENDCCVTVADKEIKGRELSESLTHLKEFYDEGQLECVHIDVIDPNSFSVIPDKTSTLINLAGYFRFWPVDEKLAKKVNIEGVKNISEFVINHPNIETLLYYSSIECVGSSQDRANPLGATEEQRPLPRDLMNCLYKETKTRGHEVAESFFKDFGKKGKRYIIRAPPTPFGPGVEKVPTGGLIKRDKGLINFMAPNTVLSCAHTSDIARDDLLILERGEHGATYVSVGFHASIFEILDTKVRIMRELGMENAKTPLIKLPNWSLQIIAKGMESIARLNGYFPSMTLEQAIRTQQNHWYNTSKTRNDLGLEKSDYKNLKETMRLTCQYFFENRLFDSMK